MYTALAYLTLAQEYRVKELKQLHRICELMDIVGGLVHCLQSERGSSNVVLASHGLRFHDKWVDFSAITDEANGRLQDWLGLIEQSGGIAGGSRLLVSLASAVYALNDLPNIRQEVRRQEITPTESTSIYSGVINALLGLVFEAADVALDPVISKALVALFHLMQAKEFAGLERAIGVRICVSTKSPEQLEALGNFIELQEQCIARFESFSTPNVLTQWGVLVRTMPITEIEQKRRRLLSPKLLDESVDADNWFAICTSRMNDMRRVESFLIESLSRQCEQLISEAREQLDDQGVLLANVHNVKSSSPTSLLVESLPAFNAHDETPKIGPALSKEILSMLQAQSNQLGAMTIELAAAKASLEERKLIERAKGILMANQDLSEEKAYSLMREKAMTQNQKLIDVAKSILSLADFLKVKH